MSTPTRSKARARRRPGKRTLLGLAVLGAACAIAVPLAWASHQFTDVPNSNPFHTEISALAGAGITAGKTCVPPGTPPTFCPDEPVVRQAMAAFLNRGLGRIALDSDVQVNIPEFGVPVELQQEELVVPGVGGSQAVKVEGWVYLDVDDPIDTCEISIVLLQDDGTASEVASPVIVGRAVTGPGDDTTLDMSVHHAWAFRTTSGLHTYSLYAGDNNCDVGDSVIEVIDSAIIATTYPFDQAGGTTVLSGASGNKNWRSEMVRSDG